VLWEEKGRLKSLSSPPARARVFGNEAADEDEVVFGNWAVAVTERLGHSRKK